MKISKERNSWNYLLSEVPHDLYQDLKDIPGVRKPRTSGSLIVPEDVLVAKGLATLNKVPTQKVDGVFPYQLQGISLGVHYKRYLFGFDMGLGKSRTAIETAKLLPHEKILVVCPSNVCLDWLSEFSKWGFNPKEVSVLEHGLKLKNMSRPKQERLAEILAVPNKITSYNLLSNLVDHHFDVIIFDEVHMLKDPKTAFHKNAAKLVENNKHAAIFGLTGTAIPNSPKDLFGILHIVWKGRFGNLVRSGAYSYQFNNRYCLKEVSEYGEKFYGLRPDNADELKRRLECVMLRATKKEWAHLLPAFALATSWIEKPKIDFAAMARQFAGNLDGFLEEVSIKTLDMKLKDIKEWLEEAQARSTHVCIATRYRASAHKIADLHGGQVITGELTPPERHEVLEKLRQSPKALLVCTMESVGIGIDLTVFSSVLLVELHHRPATVLQFLGRFPRLNSEKDIDATMLVVQGTTDEDMAAAVRTKMEDMNKLIKAGLGEEKLEQSLQRDADALTARLRGLFG